MTHLTNTSQSGGVRLEIERLGKSYGSRQVLHNTQLTIEPGEFVAIVGRSGCGKSTLLRAMGRLWPAGHGSIRMPSQRYLFLPQKPYLPIGSLREALSYPQSGDTYSPERSAQVLETCRLPHLVARLRRPERRLGEGRTGAGPAGRELWPG